MLTDKQIADALDLIDGRYHDVITKYLRKVGKTINEIGHLNAACDASAGHLPRCMWIHIPPGSQPGQYF